MSVLMRIRDIAGFCPEEAVWKMVADVSESLLDMKSGYVPSPDSVITDGGSFIIDNGNKEVPEFLAPESNNVHGPSVKEQVWSLGAVAFFAATGHIVFGGHGGCYQREHPSVSLPVLPKGMHSLTSLLQKCLCYSPDERIGLEELHSIALRGQQDCISKMRMKAKSSEDRGKKKVEKYTDEKWPEEMIEV